jgi:hypothetical protein
MEPEHIVLGVIALFALVGGVLYWQRVTSISYQYMVQEKRLQELAGDDCKAKVVDFYRAANGQKQGRKPIRRLYYRTTNNKIWLDKTHNAGVVWIGRIQEYDQKAHHNIAVQQENDLGTGVNLFIPPDPALLLLRSFNAGYISNETLADRSAGQRDDRTIADDRRRPHT